MLIGQGIQREVDLMAKWVAVAVRTCKELRRMQLLAWRAGSVVHSSPYMFMLLGACMPVCPANRNRLHGLREKTYKQSHLTVTSPIALQDVTYVPSTGHLLAVQEAVQLDSHNLVPVVHEIAPTSDASGYRTMQACPIAFHFNYSQRH